MKLSVLIFLAHFALAGNKVGNGGDVVFCEPSASRSAGVELLDFYELKANGRNLDELKPESSHMEIIEEKLNRLDDLAPRLAKQYKRRVKSILSEIDKKEGIQLTDVEDSAHISLPANCSLKQIAIRKPRVSGAGEMRFIFDLALWNQLDERNKAGLILHEIIYEHLAKLGEKDSRSARRMNGLFFSKEFSSLSKGQFWKMIGKLEVPIYP